MKIKKIAIVHSGSRFGGGVDTYYLELAKRCDSSKIELLFIMLGDWDLGKEIEKAGIQVFYLPFSRLSLSTIWKIRDIIKSNCTNLIVSQGTVSNAYARAASLLSGVPSLVTVHSDPNYDYKKRIVRILYTLVDRLTRFQTKSYIVVSKYLKEVLMKSGIKKERISVIYNGVPNNSKLATRNLKFDKSRLVVGSIGRLHHVKNYAALIEAFNKLNDLNLELHIYGEGDERQSLEKLINKYHIQDRVKLCGFESNLGKIFSDIDYYIQPSLMEGFGLTVVEAMIAGKPVIVTPVGSLKELVIDGETGILATDIGSDSLLSAIERLVSNKELTEKVARKGHKFALENFSLNRWTKETEEAYIKAAK